jgi:hypothetical protein
LDADADNAGNGGAIFVLTENAVFLNQKFANSSDVVVDNYNVENIYTESYINTNANQEYIFTEEELAEIRRITKSDAAAEMDGLFGFNSAYGYAWETDIASGYDAIVSESAVMLNGSRVFPLSAKELHDYVASYSGAPGMSAVHITTKASVNWWLRTGFNDEYGNLVGAVDKNGNVITQKATDMETAGRFAFNIETDNISYIQSVGEGVYRIALNSDIQADFNADIVDVKNCVVTIEYSGAPTESSVYN